MQNLTLILVSLLSGQVIYSSFAEEHQIVQAKVLLLSESNLKQNTKMANKNLSNSLSARLADVKMGVITPETTTQGIFTNQKDGNVKNSYQQLSLNNKITIARQLDADAILMVNLNGFTSSRVEIPNFDRDVITFKLITDYRFISCFNGSAFAGDSIIVEKKIPLTSQLGLSIPEDAILMELIEKAAALISEKILDSDLMNNEIASKFKNYSSQKIENPISKFPAKQKLVSVTISANLKNMVMPEILTGEDGKLSLTGNKIEMIPSDAQIFINGLIVGMCSNDQPVKVPEGICRLQIKRTEFVMQEKLINAYDGMKLSFTLEPTNKEYRRWEEKIRFLQEIRTGETFNQNQIKLTEGFFEFLKNSKYEVPEINLNKSLFQ